MNDRTYREASQAKHQAHTSSQAITATAWLTVALLGAIVVLVLACVTLALTLLLHHLIGLL